ncbi:MAG: ketoacyl-ACP synthase III, partial [Planctomycetota bacterium]|nr:ketoacyl-ACP synthase III [Planctomycetota bacterium]
MSQAKAYIAGCGSYLPEKVISNDDLSRLVDTTDEWIVPRTGIRERRKVEVGKEASSDLATAAGLKALEMAGVSASDLDLIVGATITPDHLFPNTACLVQRNLGAHEAAAFDLSAACAGFIYALEVAKQFVVSGTRKCVLVIGVDCMTTITDYTDRNSCIIFGDGAGAAIVRPSEGDSQIYETTLGARGEGDLFLVPAGGSRLPASHETISSGGHFLKMEGRKVFRFAVQKMGELLEAVVTQNGFSKDDVKWVIPHQVNLRIMESAFRRIEIPMDRVIINIDRYGNTSAAS